MGGVRGSLDLAGVGVYLAEPYGVVVGLRSCVEVHGLFDLLVTLVLPGQVVRSRPVPCVVGDL